MNKKIKIGLGLSLFISSNLLIMNNVEASLKSEEDIYKESIKTDVDYPFISTLLRNEVNTTYELYYYAKPYKEYIKNLKHSYHEHFIYHQFTLDYNGFLNNDLINSENDTIIEKIFKIIDENIIINEVKNGITVTDSDLNIYIESDKFYSEVVDKIKIYQDGKLLYEEEMNIYDRIDKRVYNDYVKFEDVDNSHWVYFYLQKLKQDGIIEGSNNYYYPSDYVTRGQFISMLSRAIPFIEIDKKEDIIFKDVNNHWAKDNIHLMYKLGIISGYDDGNFRPNEKITREHAVLIIDRFLKNIVTDDFSYEKNLSKNKFLDDNKINTNYKKSIYNIYNLDIVEGYNNKFNPKENLTRAQTAKIINKLLDLKLTNK